MVWCERGTHQALMRLEVNYANLVATQLVDDSSQCDTGGSGGGEGGGGTLYSQAETLDAIAKELVYSGDAGIPRIMNAHSRTHSRTHTHTHTHDSCSRV